MSRGLLDIAISRYSADYPFLFPANPPTRHVDNLGHQWHRVRNEASLPGLRLHDRHSWASVAAMNGVDMVTVATLLGHGFHGRRVCTDGPSAQSSAPGFDDRSWSQLPENVLRELFFRYIQIGSIEIQIRPIDSG